MRLAGASRSRLAAAVCVVLAACSAPQLELSAQTYFPASWPDGSWRYRLATLDGIEPHDPEVVFDGWYHERRALSQHGAAPFADAYNQYVSDRRNKVIYFALPDGIGLELFGVHDHWIHYDPPLLLVPAHPRPGDRWTWQGELTGSAASRSSTLSVEPLVHRDSGPLLHIRERRDDGTVIDRWFAPSIGLVAMKEHRAGRVSFELELVEFTARPAAP